MPFVGTHILDLDLEHFSCRHLMFDQRYSTAHRHQCQESHNNALHVLSTPELLNTIFQFLDDASNASNAIVCRQWSDIALDLLWHEVQDMYRLLSVLGPLEAVEDDDSLRFARKLRFSDWETFERYRYRVKSLTYQSSKPKLIHPTALEELGRSRISMEVLPNIHTLEWDGPLEFCTIFMHRGVKSLIITLPENQVYVDDILEDAGARMQNLTQLDLRLSFGISAIESSVTPLLSKLPNLRKFSLPRYCFTSGIARAASHIRKLESIELSDSQYFGDWSDVVHFNPLLQDDAYQSLNKLRTFVSFTNAATFVGKLGAPTNLTVLYIGSSLETAGGFTHLVTAISNNLHCLTSLHLNSFLDPDKLKNKIYRQENCVTFAHLRPLLRCSRLASFKIKHHYPLHLELTDVEKIAIAWPGLVYISLNPGPFYMDRSDLTLDALLPFARHCPNIRTIGLFLNATINQSTTDHLTYPRFRVLDRLLLGASIIKDEFSVASFLSLICPSGCEVDKLGVAWDTSECAKEMLDALEFRENKWLTVIKWLPILLNCRREEEERSQWKAKDRSNEEVTLAQ